MTTAAKIQVLVEAQTAALEKGFDKVDGSVRGLSRRVQSGFSRARTTYLSFSQAVRDSLAVIGRISGFVAEFDRLAKVAGNLGLSARELGGFQLAAQKAGGQIEQINQLLFAFQRRLGEAAAGTGEAVGVFAALDLDPVALSQRNLASAYEIVTERINKLANQYDRTAAQQKIFGEGARELQNFLEGGGALIDEQTARYEELVGQMDPGKVEAFNDAWLELSVAFKAALVEWMGPVLKWLADFSKGLADAKSKFEAFSLYVGDKLTGGGQFANFADAANTSRLYDQAVAEQAEAEARLKAKQRQRDAEQARLNLGAQSEKAEQASEKITENVRDMARSFQSIGGVGIGTRESGGFSAIQAAIRQRHAAVVQREKMLRLLDAQNKLLAELIRQKRPEVIV